MIDEGGNWEGDKGEDKMEGKVFERRDMKKEGEKMKGGEFMTV
jgi:hypothetical protein